MLQWGRMARNGVGRMAPSTEEPEEGRMTSGNGAPVGVFDSGVGGLTILRELLRELPDERFVYVGDTGNCPYGVRPAEEIQALSRAVTRFLIARGAKLIVVACNTVSVSARTELRAEFSLPFVMVVPPVKPAAAMTRRGKIGIAATEASARGGYLRTLIADHAEGVEVLAAGCPRLIELVEAGVLDGPEAEEAIRGYIQPMLDAGIDVLALGCTHFPAMGTCFARVVGPTVAVIDSGAAVARQTRSLLAEGGLLAAPYGGPADAPRALEPRDELWCSGAVGRFERAATAILRQAVRVRFAAALATPPVEA